MPIKILHLTSSPNPSDLVFSYISIKFLSKFSDSLTDSYDVVNNSIKPKIFVISSILSASYWILESIAVYFIFQSFGIDFIELIQVIPTYATSIILGVA